MKERPIIISTQLIPKILDGTKTQTRMVVTNKTSVIGEGGDWAKLCWDGSEINTECCFHPDCQHNHESKAPLPFVDHGFPNPTTGKKDSWYLHVPYHWAEDGTIYRIYPKWQVGDRLWCKETFMFKKGADCREFCIGTPQEVGLGKPPHFLYKADNTDEVREYESWHKWRSPLFMPRYASRITLEITKIRVERLQEIDLEDVMAEGIDVALSPLGYDPLDLKAIENKIILDEFAGLWDSLNAKRGYSWESNPWVWVIEFRKVSP